MSVTSKSLRRVGIAALLLVVLGLAIPWPFASSPAGTVKDYVNGLVAAGVPGVSVVVAERGAVETISSGDVEQGDQIPVASLTKSFTAAAVMRLVEQGRVDLDAPVHQFLPELELADARTKDVTVRHVLNQSSGITDLTLGFDQYAVHPASAQEAVGLLGATRLAYDPGTSWDYCNVNYWIAQALVERITGAGLQDYLDQEFFRPLGMTSTRLTDHTDGTSTSVEPHAYAFGHAVTVPSPRIFVGGAGGVATTMNDLAQWLRFHQGEHPNGGQVLSAASIAELHRRQSPLTQYKVGYALGWWNGEPADGGFTRVSHSGSGAGYSAYAGLFPDGTAVAVFVSASSPRADDVAADVLAIHGGENRTPLRGAPAWPDSVACILGILCIAGSVRGIRNRLRGSSTWRSHIIAALAALGAGALLAAPALTAYVFQRQATWTLLFTSAPVPVVCVAVVVVALLALVVTHALTVVTGMALQARPGSQ